MSEGESREGAAAPRGGDRPPREPGGLTWTPSRAPGARLAVSDLVVLGLAGAGARGAAAVAPELGGLVFLVVGHFFLFCNVVRAATRHELAWCGLLGTNLGFWAWQGWPGWGPVLAVQLAGTAWVVARTWAREDYRGVFYTWRRGWGAGGAG